MRANGHKHPGRQNASCCHKVQRVTTFSFSGGPDFFSLFIFLVQPAASVGLGSSSARSLDGPPVLAGPVDIYVISTVLWQM